MHMDLLTARRLAGAHPTWPILVVAQSPWNYEPVATFERWMAFEGITNPLYLVVDVPATKSALEKSLVEAMEEWAREGGKGYAAGPVSIPPDGNCFAVNSRPEGPASKCQQFPFTPNKYVPRIPAASRGASG